MPETWHILDAGSIWIKEFAAALAPLRRTECWVPKIRNFGVFEDWEDVTSVADPPVQLRSFPLQRAYSRYPLSRILPSGKQIVQRIVRNFPNPAADTLVCTSPFYAPVAEAWPGRVIYYLTDKTAAYEGMNPVQIGQLDRRMCERAELVCPNSKRTGRYLHEETGCPEDKIVVIPNATRQSNVLDQTLVAPGPGPTDIADLPRPWVGVIGNLAANVDWHLIRSAVAQSENVSWVFVGPHVMPIADPKRRAIRQEMLNRPSPRVRFTGAKPYGELAQYGRSFDAAFLPYFRREPMLSASATRFYEHLAACRPILATPGVEELLEKEPLLKLVTTGSEVAFELRRLSGCGFRDGQEEARWRASHEGTWECRARAMVHAADTGLDCARNLV